MAGPEKTKTEHQAPEVLQARRKGRRLVMTTYFFVVILVCLIPLVQITRQVFFPPPYDPALRPRTCDEGIEQLYRGVLQARAACASIDLPEEQAVARFRASLGDRWKDVRAVRDVCANDPQALEVLDAIRVLRYTEEMSVRHASIHVDPVRARAKRLVNDYLGRSR